MIYVAINNYNKKKDILHQYHLLSGGKYIFFFFDHPTKSKIESNPSSIPIHAHQQETPYPVARCQADGGRRTRDPPWWGRHEL